MFERREVRIEHCKAQAQADSRGYLGLIPGFLQVILPHGFQDSLVLLCAASEPDKESRLHRQTDLNVVGFKTRPHPLHHGSSERSQDTQARI